MLQLVAKKRATGTNEELIEFLRSEIARLINEATSEGRLRLFTTTVHLLLAFERDGFTGAKEIRDAVDLCFTILRVQRIDPERSKFCYLYGLVYSLVSQLDRRRGNHFEAAWNQCLADRHSCIDDGQLPAFMRYCQGNRSFRLGHGSLALKKYEMAEKLNLPERWMFQSSLNRAMLSRLLGDWGGAETHLSAAEKYAKDAELKADLDWQRLSAQAQRTADLSAMVKACRKGGMHFRGHPLVECALWAMATHSTQWIEQLPNLSGVRYDKGLKVRDLGLIYEIGCALQDFYRAQAKLVTRLRDLGSLLARSSELLTIDQEALVWLAAMRALKRAKAIEFAEVCRFRYVTLSRKLTDGRDSDCLNLAPDIDNMMSSRA